MIFVVIPFILGIPFAFLSGLGFVAMGAAVLAFFLLLLQYLLDSDQVLYLDRNYLLQGFSGSTQADPTAKRKSLRFGPIVRWLVWGGIAATVLLAAGIAAVALMWSLGWFSLRDLGLQSLAAPAAASATVAPNNTFETSAFCRHFRCRLYDQHTERGITTYYYETSISDGQSEANVTVDPFGEIWEYVLSIQPVSIEDADTSRPTVNWPNVRKRSKPGANLRSRGIPITFCSNRSLVTAPCITGPNSGPFGLIGCGGALNSCVVHQ